MATQVFEKGLNVVINDGVNIPTYIPVRAARVQPHNDNVNIQDHETGNTKAISLDDLRDGDGNTFATIDLAMDYLSEFIGGFKNGGGVGNGSAIVVGSVNTFNDLPPASDFTGLYYAVQNGSGGVNIPLIGRIGGNDPGLYLSDGANWNLNRDLDASDITVNSSTLNFTSNSSLDDILIDIDNQLITNQERLGINGSVVVHQDVSDAGSGVIISDQERGDINASIGVHSDVDLTGVTPKNGWLLKYVSGILILTMKERIESLNLEVNTQNANNLSKINETLDFQRLGRYSLDVSYSFSNDSTTGDFISQLEFDGQPTTIIANNESIRQESKDSVGNDGDGRGTDQKKVFRQRYYVNITTIGPKNIELLFRPSQNNTEAAMWNASIIVEEEF